MILLLFVQRLNRIGASVDNWSFICYVSAICLNATYLSSAYLVTKTIRLRVNRTIKVGIICGTCSVKFLIQAAAKILLHHWACQDHFWYSTGSSLLRFILAALEALSLISLHIDGLGVVLSERWNTFLGRVIIFGRHGLLKLIGPELGQVTSGLIKSISS